MDNYRDGMEDIQARPSQKQLDIREAIQSLHGFNIGKNRLHNGNPLMVYLPAFFRVDLFSHLLGKMP